MDDKKLKATKDLRKLPLVEVSWEDATSHGGWRTLGDHRKVLLTRCASMGYLIKRTRKIVQIVQTAAESGEVLDSLTIPAGSVTRIRRLKR